MEEHIIALLKNNLRVIIPDFGAFIVKQKEPEIIVFNEFLRYNDGLLIDYISKTEQLDKEIAANKVAEFAEESSGVLESGKGLEIKGLGSLSRDASGKIHFTGETAGGKKLKKEAPVTENITRKAAEKKEPEPEKAKPAAEKKEQEPEKAKPAAEKKEPEPEKTKPAAEKKELEPEKAKPAAEKKEPASEKAKPAAEKKEPASEKPMPAEEKATGQGPDNRDKVMAGSATMTAGTTPRVSQSESRTSGSMEREVLPAAAHKKNSTVNQILIWIGIFLAANIIVFAWFLYRDQIKGFFGKGEKSVIVADSLAGGQGSETSLAPLETDTLPVATEEAPAVQEPASVQEIPAVQETPEIQQTASLPAAASSQPKYYIVAGCFREESNADALVLSLRSKGYDAEKFGKIGNLHAVSYEAFGSQAEALKELERIREEEQPEAWMTRF